LKLLFSTAYIYNFIKAELKTRKYEKTFTVIALNSLVGSCAKTSTPTAFTGGTSSKLLAAVCF